LVSSAARLPPPLAGLDPSWSRLVPTVDADGVTRTWHVLDSHAGPAPTSAEAGPPVGTLLCVHGNPTWSYLWRHLVAAPPPGWRVVAVDQLGMGFSDRANVVRRLATRIDDLGRLTDSLGVAGPVVTVAHDWGGPISLGWARDHRGQVAGIVLTNTAVHQPAGSPAPALIRLAGTAGVRQLLCQITPAFLSTAVGLSRPRLAREVRAGFHAPYRGRVRRRAIADFVADIPLDPAHPSAPALADVVAALPGLARVPVLLLWGPRDPVFSDRYLRDLLERFPHADVHRFEGASHLVTEDRPDTADVISRWVQARVTKIDAATAAAGGAAAVGDDAGGGAAVNDGVGAAADVDASASATASAGGSAGARAGTLGDEVAGRSLSWRLEARRRDEAVAMVEVGGATISFAGLNRRVDDVAIALTSAGVRAGQRVVLLIEPGIELTAVVYACWRIGAVIVVADAGLGLRRLGRALRGSGGDWVVAARRGLVAARALRVPGRRLGVGSVPSTILLGDAHLDRIAAVGPVAPRALADDDDCAVVFTSGATGPPKGVVYRRGQLRRQIEVLAETYGVSADDRLVAAFAPFALYGPALGIASTVPDVDVTKPATLTAAALADAVASIDATVVFASPAALTNVVATASALDEAQRATLRGPRLVLSAGAPLPLALVRQVAQLLPGSDVRTPYGMTEVLPVTDISLVELEAAAGHGRGVCVGRPVPGVRLAVLPLVGAAEARHPVGFGYGAGPVDLVDVTGEICVSAAHGKHRYDRLWATEADSARYAGWHRTGDLGHVDADGRLWVEGRRDDVVHTATGPVTPVPIEQRIQDGAAAGGAGGPAVGVAAAAIVGVGPDGARQLVAVVVPAVGSTPAVGSAPAGGSVPAPGSVSTVDSDGPATTVASAAEPPVHRPRRRRRRRRRQLRMRVADLDLASGVRAAAGAPIAAVLTTSALPVDIRHNSKIDHPALARAAEKLLAGRGTGRPDRT
jgi:olefin beta-lactone synthetase